MTEFLKLNLSKSKMTYSSIHAMLDMDVSGKLVIHREYNTKHLKYACYIKCTFMLKVFPNNKSSNNMQVENSPRVGT